MYRKIEEDLKLWQTKPHRKPLIVRGARQVGKTFIIKKFGQQHFKHLVTVNFEKQPQLADIFNLTLDPEEIIDFISKRLQKAIIPGETLLFLDEIQITPRALLALRYFKEDMQKLHVIAAGSLLEFALNKANFSMPVGRVEYLYMKPVSFHEYLLASGRENILSGLKQATTQNPVDPVSHSILIEELKKYYEIGGMPEVVNHFVKHNGTLLECQQLQSSIIDVYKSDFGKYDVQIRYQHLDEIFQKSPYIVGEKFKYTKINPDIDSRTLKPALQALIDAGLIYRIYHSSGSGLPFGATKNDRIFKLLFLDEGLVRHAVNTGTIATKPDEWPAQNQGALSEQFVGQELMAYGETYRAPELYFWDREKPSSTAEIDYLINIGDTIFPIEVKSGKTGRLKSLQVFITEKQSPFGIRISETPLSFENGVLSIPLYMIFELKRLIQTHIGLSL